MTDQIGKYTLKRHLATGGMAEIWLAEHTGPEGFARDVVIKRILGHFARDPQFIDMFLDEARLASQLAHPNIGQILELGEADDHYFIAMEFIDGLSFEEMLEKIDEDDQADQIPVDLAARMVADVLQALDYAHASTDRDGELLHIVHRDVTPSNVIVSKDGIVKLVDFGVAKAAAKRSKTQTGAVKGKYAYMAPEQIESDEIDHRADLFALGVVFYELLTGTKPFGEELAAVTRILTSEHEDPRKLRPDVPEPYAQIIARALEKEPEARYASAHAMLLDIETALRMRNSYVGPRDLAHFVRTLRGMKVARPHVADDTSGIFAADRSSDRLRLTLQPGLAATTSEIEEASASAEAPLETVTVESVAQTTRPSSRNRTLIWIAGALVGLVLAAGATLAVVVATNNAAPALIDGKSYALTVEPREPEPLDDAKPDSLRDDGGRPVIIETIPESRVYRSGTLIGATPIATTLSPGNYHLDFRRGEEHKHATLTVESGEGTQRHRMLLAHLDEADAAKKGSRAASKDGEKKKRRSSRPKIIRQIESIFH